MKCYGAHASTVTHAKACRPGRPLCRWRRAIRWGVCWCGAMAFPHRKGSGACGDPARNWDLLLKPMRNGNVL